MSETEYKLWLERWGGWALIFLFAAIPVIRWLMIMPLSSRVNGSFDIFTSLGRLTGLVGYMLFAINMLLSIRRRWLEKLFGGLNRVYIAHHLTGGLAFILILFHPLFLSIRFIELSSLRTLKDAADSLLPKSLPFQKTYYEVQQAVAINNGIIAFLGLTVLLIVTFFGKLPYRIWLATHKFLGIAFAFAGLHVLLIASDVYHDGFLKFYIGLWLAIGLTAYIYRTLLSNIFVRRAPYKVVGIRTLPGDVMAVSFEPIDKPIDFKPGQFVFVRFLWAQKHGIGMEIHPFSIASSPKSKGMELYMKALGDFTKSLKNLQPGVVVEVEGAFGGFTPGKYPQVPQIWIAGGIGITPFLSLAHNYDESQPPVDLFYSVKARSELIEQATLAEFLPTKFKQYAYHPFVSDEQKGFLSAKFITEHTPGGVAGKEIFICGPPPMMHAVRSQLRALGVKNSKIHSEEFSMQ